ATQEAIDQRLAAFAASHPGISFTRIYSTVGVTQDSYTSSLGALIDGALLAVGVVWLFLRNARATAIAAVSIPLSSIANFSVLELLRFSLNWVSLLALALASGVVVDDAIVEVENIERCRQAGMSARLAAMAGASEMAFPVMATSAVLI